MALKRDRSRYIGASAEVAVDSDGGLALTPASRFGGVPEWLKGADCKSAGVRLRWFESSPLHQPEVINIISDFLNLAATSPHRTPRQTPTRPQWHCVVMLRLPSADVCGDHRRPGCRDRWRPPGPRRRSYGERARAGALRGHQTPCDHGGVWAVLGIGGLQAFGSPQPALAQRGRGRPGPITVTLFDKCGSALLF